MAESRARTPGPDEDTDEALGELDWDFPEPDPPVAAKPTSAITPTNVSARQTVRRDESELDAVIEEERDKTPPPPPPSASGVETTGDRVAAMRDAYARGDADGALAIASAMEGATMPPPPGGIDHPDAGVEIEVAGETEIDIDDVEPGALAPPPMPALSSLTERQGIPRVLLGPQEIAKLPLDHRTGFLLGYMDGMQTMEEILDVCPLPPNEALELIRTLVEMGVIEIE